MKIAITVFALATVIACEVAPPKVTELSPDKFLKSPPANALVLDVRTAEEFASGHVPGAVNIPHNELASRIEELGADTSKPVVVYCERGGRASKAASVLRDGGFSDVRHLAGDMSEWRAKGRAMEMPASVDTSAIRKNALQFFAALPSVMENPSNALTDAKVDLGRMLFFDTRLSKNHDISCNSCHLLDEFGQDGEPTSTGHQGQRGGRNSPTVYNAALHVAQFWDGRAADVEEQAKGPILNPIEMAMPSEDAVLAVLRSIPGYNEAFAAAFPKDSEPLTYDNMALAIGAFERGLTTPGRFDAFLEGDNTAFTDAELEGLNTFISTGCIICHMGPAVGGTLLQKLGLVKPYPTKDQGRFEATAEASDRGFFKVPSLRNITETGPYLHDGSVPSLESTVNIMAEYQLGKSLSEDDNKSIRTFLAALMGTPDASYIAPPELPESGPATPAPDAS